MSGAVDPLHARAVLVDSLSSALRRGGSALGSVPGLLKQILADEGWREFITQRDELVRHERFEDFVTAAPLRGLGADLDLVRRIVSRDAEAEDLLTRATRGVQGRRTDLVDNINEVSRPDGTSREQALRSLRKNAPELHSRVLAGELSPHAAMVEAGLRPQTFTIRITSPEIIARTLRKQLPPDVLEAVRRELDAA